METTTITVMVDLIVESKEKLTMEDKEQVVADMDYRFSFVESIDSNPISIVDMEITDMLESD